MRQRTAMTLFLFTWLAVTSSAQEQITKVEVNTVPSDRRVRPMETAVIQLVTYGDVTGTDGTKKNVRVKRRGANFHILDKDGGWLSKPFLFQGIDGVSSFLESRYNLPGLLGTMEDFVSQDSVLYTAPEKPGKYTIEVSLEGKSAKTQLEVTPKAASRRPSERTSFSTESTRDPYLPLAAHYAPWIAQETWFTPKADFVSRFDYDGDWKGDNNWGSLDAGSSQAYVYYTVMETPTHWFLIYNFYHPRDYSDNCIAGTCHENDNEGLILTVGKDGSTYGHPEVMETLAHNNVYSFRADRQIQDGVHDIDGEIEWVGQSHPVVFIEAGGHGVFGSDTHHARFSLKTQFTAGTGITYVYKGKAERPRHANDREVGYDLLPIYDQWWSKVDPAMNWKERTFDDFFTYQPLGGRPGARFPQIPGAFLGRKESSNKARPFWGWHDNLTAKKNVLSTGQWGLDPAYAVSHDLHFPEGERFSLDYIYNPYLNLRNTPSQGEISSSPTTSQRNQTGAPPTGNFNFPQAAGGTPSSSVNTSAGLRELASSRSRDYNIKSKEGSLDLRLYVDGTVNLYIRGDQVQYKVTSGRPPREDKLEFTQPIPKAPLKSFKAEKKDGRGKFLLVEQPTPENDYTAWIRIDDPKGGEDHYRVEVKWKR